VTIGRDQLRVLVALEREGVEGEGQPSPWLASQQLALALDDPERTTAPPSRSAVRRSRRDAKRPRWVVG
jgi:hypothetical protein